jgi:hypothetical protein
MSPCRKTARLCRRGDHRGKNRRRVSTAPIASDEAEENRDDDRPEGETSQAESAAPRRIHWRTQHGAIPGCSEAPETRNAHSAAG